MLTLPRPLPSFSTRSLSLLPSLIIVFIVFIPTCFSEDDDLYTACAPQNISCGSNNFEIRFPFRAPPSQGDKRPDYCSYPGYNLSCYEGNLLDASLGSNFSVESIDYDNHTLHIVDAYYNNSAGYCPRPERNSTIQPRNYMTSRTWGSSGDFPFEGFDYAEGVQSITLYLNCSEPANAVDLGRIDCLAVKQEDGLVLSAYFSLRPPEGSSSCNPPLIIPVMRAEAKRLWNNGGSSFGAALRSGFDVGWVSGREICKSCEGSGGRCGFNPSNRTQFRCFCRGGPEDSSCPSASVSPSPSLRPGGAEICKSCVRSGGRCGFDPSNRTDFKCFCSDGPEVSTCPTLSVWPGGSKSRIIPKIIIAIGAAVVTTILVTCVLLLMRKFKKVGFNIEHVQALSLRRNANGDAKAFLQGYGSMAPTRFRYSELKKMTNSFQDKLGQGGFGAVFKGKLNAHHLVAVKLLNNPKGNGEEFMNEVASIGRTSHVNIVTLVGYCFEGSKRALVYEFMSNGSLEKFIYSSKSECSRCVLDCRKLHEIAVGVARGLEYLHRGCRTRILHFDIKPHNILLDDELRPKISDFGLAKLCPTKESIISMHDARGTMGYVAPEVYCRNIGGVSHKSDVYSYGMMVLEMVGGRKNIDAAVENTSEIYFPHWAYKHIALQDNLELIGITEDEQKVSAKKMVLVGLWCIQTDPSARPSMTEVLEMLEGSVEGLKVPQKPYLSSPNRS